MKLKTIITCLALGAACCGLQAQDKPKENPWFLQGQLGMTYATGGTGIGRLLSPGGSLSVGKYFSPVWGARLNIGGWVAKTPGVYSGSDSFFYGSATVDGLMNLSQLIRRYPERLFDVNVIAGIGFNRSFNHASSFMGKLGLIGSFRLNSAIDFNIEATANGVGDRWNGRDDHGIDTYFNLGLGFTYKFGRMPKCVTCISEEYPETMYSEEDMNELVNRMREAAKADCAESRVDTVLVEKDCPPASNTVVKGIRSHVQFQLGRSDIQPSQEMNIVAIADYMKQYPTCNATINGYADKGTGTREINVRLAKQRAEKVRDCLVQKYGIDAKRLSVMSMEGDEQPFANNNDWNRVVIIMAD